MVKVISTVEEFEKEVEKSEVPVIIDFFAVWCGPCRMVAPIFDKLDKEYDGKVKFVKINVDEAQELAVRFNVMSIPTIIAFKDGKVADQKVGALPEPMLKSWVDSLN